MAKIKVFTGVHARAEFRTSYGWWRKTPEEQAKELEQTAREFEAFVRDHRSQDPVFIEIIREFEDQCSHCGYEWSVNEEGVPLCCQKAIDEFEAGKALAMEESHASI